MTSKPRTIESLILVYNAGWSLLGGLKYVSSILRGANECALCEITHNTITEKSEWKACRDNIGVPVEAVFRNQTTPELEEAVEGEFPSVVAKTPEGYVRLLDREALEDCGRDVDNLYTKLQESAEARNLSWS